MRSINLELEKPLCVGECLVIFVALKDLIKCSFIERHKVSIINLFRNVEIWSNVLQIIKAFESEIISCKCCIRNYFHQLRQ